MKTIHIKDVALEAGVSVATVTRVINNSGYASPQSREKVMEAVERLGYIPNRIAGALKSQNSRMIGLIVPFHETNSFFTQMEHTITRYAALVGFRLITMTSGGSEEEGRLIGEMIGRMVEGIILMGGSSVMPKNMKSFTDKNMPILTIERSLHIPSADRLLVDDLRGSAMVAETFLAKGHRRIALIAVRGNETVESNRLKGFVSVMSEAGFPVPEENIIYAKEYSVEEGRSAMEHLLMSRQRGLLPTALYVTSDILACGVLQVLYRNCINVPQEMSVVGYDNTLSTLTAPAISSVAIPIEEMGKTAVDLFLERRDGGRSCAKCVTLSPWFVDRGTVAKI